MKVGNHDANMVEESRDNVDVLLVFVSPRSHFVCITAEHIEGGSFLSGCDYIWAQTSQSLQPDYAAMSASLLYESILVQRAISNGSPVNSIAPSPLTSQPLLLFQQPRMSG